MTNFTIPAVKIADSRRKEYNASWLAADKADSRKWLATVALRIDAAPQLRLITGRGGLTDEMVARAFAKALLPTNVESSVLEKRGTSINQMWSQVSAAEKILGKTAKVKVTVSKGTLVFTTSDDETYAFTKREALADFNAIRKTKSGVSTDLVEKRKVGDSTEVITIPRKIVRAADGTFTTERGARVVNVEKKPAQTPGTPPTGPVKSYDEAMSEKVIKISPELRVALKDVRGGVRVLTAKERLTLLETAEAILTAVAGQSDVMTDKRSANKFTKISREVVGPFIKRVIADGAKTPQTPAV